MNRIGLLCLTLVSASSWSADVLVDVMAAYENRKPVLEISITNLTTEPVHITNLDVPWYRHLHSLNIGATAIRKSLGKVTELESLWPPATLDIVDIEIPRLSSISGQILLERVFHQMDLFDQDLEYFVYWSMATKTKKGNSAATNSGSLIIRAGLIKSFTSNSQ